jgi:hypothetical protein
LTTSSSRSMRRGRTVAKFGDPQRR